MIVQVAILDENNKAVNIIAVESADVTPEFLDPFVEGIGATSWLDLRETPYPWDWDRTDCIWNVDANVWSYPDGFTNELPAPTPE